MDKNYGEIFKKHRKIKGLTQSEVAILTGYSIATIKNIENKNHIPNIDILKAYKRVIPSLNKTIDEMLKVPKRTASKSSSEYTEKIDMKYLDEEVKNKLEELEEIKRLLLMKRMEYEALERTSGVRSRLTWACIDIQKNDASKITEITNIFNLADPRQQKECLPAIMQLWKHFVKFQRQLEELINENKGEIQYE